MSHVTFATNTLPWTCPQHPQAQIRHSWDRTQYVMNGYPSGAGIDGNHRYECAECGLQLAAPTAQRIAPERKQGEENGNI